MLDLNKLRSEFEAQHSDKVFKIVKFDEATNAYCLHAHLPLTEINLSALAEINYGWDLWQKAKAQAVPDTKPIAYKVSFDSWQRQHGKDYFEFWKPDEFEDYKPDYLIPLYSFPTISSDFVVVPKEPTQKMLNAAHCYMNPVKGSDVHPETNRKRREMYKAMVKASESGAEG